jgi:hypothetical protein
MLLQFANVRGRAKPRGETAHVALRRSLMEDWRRRPSMRALICGWRSAEVDVRGAIARALIREELE